MNAISLFRLCAMGLLLVGATSSWGGEADPAMVEIHGQFIHATKAQIDKALEAAGSGRASATLSLKQASIALAKLKESGADVFSDLRVIAQSGQPARIRNSREITYPTAFEASTREKDKSVPTAFETRNIGVVLAVTPEILAGAGIKLKVEAEHTRFLGFIDYSNGAQADGAGSTLDELLKAPLKAGGMWQPIFAATSINTIFDLSSGQVALLGGPVTTEAGDKEHPQSKESASAEDMLIFISAKVIAH